MRFSKTHPTICIALFMAGLVSGPMAYAQDASTCIPIFVEEEEPDPQDPIIIRQARTTASSTECFNGVRAQAILTNQPNLNIGRSVAIRSGLTSGNVINNIETTQGAVEANTTEGYEGPIWVTLSARNSELEDDDLEQGIATIGGDVVTTDNAVFGLMVQSDYAFQDAEAGDSFDATGIMGGVYAIYNTNNLTLDARLLGGTASNDVASGGERADDVDSTRVLAAAQVSTFTELANGRLLIPHASVGYLRDTMDEYMLGPVTVEESEIEYGQADIGGTLLLPIGLGTADGNVVLGSSVLFAFGPAAGEEVPDDVRGRIDLGVEFYRADLWAISANVFTDGIGQDDFEAVGADLGVTLWF